LEDDKTYDRFCLWDTRTGSVTFSQALTYGGFGVEGSENVTNLTARIFFLE
jgi:hypothetical protein